MVSKKLKLWNPENLAILEAPLRISGFQKIRQSPKFPEKLEGDILSRHGTPKTEILKLWRSDGRRHSFSGWQVFRILGFYVFPLSQSMAEKIPRDSL